MKTNIHPSPVCSHERLRTLHIHGDDMLHECLPPARHRAAQVELHVTRQTLGPLERTADVHLHGQHVPSKHTHNTHNN